MSNLIKVKRGTKSSLPTLNVGELGFCSDTNELYIGTASGNVKLAPSASGAAYLFPPKLVSGVYFCPLLFNALTTQVLTANRVYLAPFILGQALTVTTVAIQVTTAGASGTVAQAGVYSNGSDNSPNSLLYSTGDLATDVTGTPTTSVSWSLQANTVYWLAIQGSGTPNLRAVVPAIGWVYLSGTTGTIISYYYYVASSYGLPNSLSGVTLNQAGGGCPIVGFRY